LLKGIDEEMHSNWWVFLGIKKSCGDEKKKREFSKWWDYKP
jgi:hypothetical protein